MGCRVGAQEPHGGGEGKGVLETEPDACRPCSGKIDQGLDLPTPSVYRGSSGVVSLRLWLSRLGRKGNLFGLEGSRERCSL